MTVRFSGDGPCFPGKLIDSLMDGEVVFLCGAGVSAPLPNFLGLVKGTYENLDIPISPAEQKALEKDRFEEVLASLSRKLASPDMMIRKISELLSITEPTCISHHRTILRLSRDRDNRFCVITTNFDTLLERAAAEILPKEKMNEISFAGQVLPSPGTPSFSGIMHIHGRLEDEQLSLNYSQLILTSEDYGDAYMRSGWISRFLFDLARCKTVVLIGYSANDAPVRYILNVLQADRARFPDIKSVYAFHGDTEEAWEILPVEPLPYCVKNPDSGEDDHTPLWRDLETLANALERPERFFQERARAILEHPVEEAHPASLSELSWLFSEDRNLWSIVLNTISDPGWFTHFHDKELLTKDDLAWVIPTWIAKNFQNIERFECALKWQRILGPSFAQEIQKFLFRANNLDKIWARNWRLLCLFDTVRGNDHMDYYTMKKHLRDGVIVDADLQKAVNLLTPRPAWERRDYGVFFEENSEDFEETNQRSPASPSAHMEVSDHNGAMDLVGALSEMPTHSLRILELATSELRSSLALQSEFEPINEERDPNDWTVASIEENFQNRYRGGINFLIRVMVNCIPHATALNRDHTREIASSWKRLPGRIGLRLFLHAARNVELFDAKEALSDLLLISDANFWSIRRELALVLKHRAQNCSPGILRRIERRIRETGDAYYGQSLNEEGDPDGHKYVRDITVWLYLRMLQEAGVLSKAGAKELSRIGKRRPHLDHIREIEDPDFFRNYRFGVRSIKGDPTPIIEAPKEKRLQTAHELANDSDFEMREAWPEFCQTRPQEAFDCLAEGGFESEDLSLWKNFLNVLASGEESNRDIRENVAIQVMEYFSEMDVETLDPVAPELCGLLSFTSKEEIPGIDNWLAKLWELITQLPDGPIEFSADLYGKAINHPAGKLSQKLLREIHKQKQRNEEPTDTQRHLIEGIITDESNAGLLGCSILVHDVSFLFTIDQNYVTEIAIRINAENDAGVALRAVMLTSLVYPDASKMLREPIIKGIIESTAVAGLEEIVAANIVYPALTKLSDDYSVEWGQTVADIKRALREAKSAIRSGVLQVLTEQLRDRPEEVWDQVIVPFFKNFWPQEREFVDASLTGHIIDLIVSSGQKFPVALEFMRCYISPYNQGHGNLQAIINSEVPEKFPKEVLDLMWLVCGPKSSGSFYTLSDVIEKLVEADSKLETDRRLLWLKRQVQKYS